MRFRCTYSLLLVVCLVNGALYVGCGLADSKDASPNGMIKDIEFDLQGHRGARGRMPENTIPGFLHALEVGVTTLEMDIVISADSQVVVSHEPWFSRHICLKPSGKRIRRWNQKRFRIFDMSYDEVAAFDCGSVGHPSFPRQKKTEVAKPLLGDVIAAAEERAARMERAPVWYSIETKTRPEWDNKFHPEPETVVRLLYEVLEEENVLNRATIQSFDMRTLRIAREMALPARLSLLIRRRNRKSVQENVEALGFTPTVYSPDYRLIDQAVIDRAHELGMKIIPWTVNDLETMEELKSMGVDGLITDYPDRGQELLQ